MENITLEQLNSILSNYVSTSQLESRIQNFTTVNEVLSNIKIGSVDAELLSSNHDAYANVSATDDGHLNFKFGMPRGYNGLNGEGAVIDYEYLKVWISELGLFATIEDLDDVKHTLELTSDTFNSKIEDIYGKYSSILQRLTSVEIKVGNGETGEEGGIYVTEDWVKSYVTNNITNKFSSIEQTIDEIKLEIGSYPGNNLLINSQFANDTYGWSITND